MGEVGQVTVKCNILISSLYNQVFKLTFFPLELSKCHCSLVQSLVYLPLCSQEQMFTGKVIRRSQCCWRKQNYWLHPCVPCVQGHSSCRTWFNYGARSHEALEESPSASPHIITNAFFRATLPSCFLRSLAPNKLDSSTWTQQVNTEGGGNIFNIQINICIYFFWEGQDKVEMF